MTEAIMQSEEAIYTTKAHTRLLAVILHPRDTDEATVPETGKE